MISRVQTRTQRHAARQRGFTLLAGVMLITILAALSAFMVSFRLYQDAGESLDTLGTRAFAAARAGVEWGVYNSLQNNACAASTAPALGGTLSGFTVTVTCTTPTPFDEGDPANPVNMYTITANACNQPSAGSCPNTATAPGANYAERQITVVVGQ
jgi:MSHA biogenesis protein MshP